jgi:plasmid stabilization system protein ParE
LRRICQYVDSRFGSEVAGRVERDLEGAFEQLATYPDIGHHRDDLTADQSVRFWVVGPTLIAYRSRLERVEILFVERGDIDWERVLLEAL